MDCFACIPQLLDDNQAVAQIWLLTRGQVISIGMGGIIDLNHLALWKNIEQFRESYEIEDVNDCFLRVLKLFHVFLEEDHAQMRLDSVREELSRSNVAR